MTPASKRWVWRAELGARALFASAVAWLVFFIWRGMLPPALYAFLQRTVVTAIVLSLAVILACALAAYDAEVGRAKGQGR